MKNNTWILYRIVATVVMFIASSQTPCRALESGVVTLVTTGACWRLHDRGSNEGTDWKYSGTDDSAWRLGFAELGYGDGDEATLVDFGPDANDKYITTYFRHDFVAPSPSIFNNLRLRVKRDDGIVVYLNGEEVYRNNLSPTPNYLSLASPASNDGTNFTTVSVNPSYLLPQENVLAVEIHQAGTNDLDISFDLELVGNYGPVFPPLTGAAVGANQFVVSWPSSASSSFVLQSSSQLNPTVWTTVSNTPVITGGNYRVTNTIAGASRFYRLCAAAESVVHCQPPIVLSQPLEVFADIGTNVTLSIVATGTPTIAYQWFHNRLPIAGAVTSVLTLTNVQRTDGGCYELCMAGPCETGFSAPITLVVGGTNVVMTDDFASRPVFSDVAGEINSSNLLASAEAGEPAHAGYAAERSMWMSFVSPMDGVVEFTTVGSSFDTVLAAYQGTDVAALSPIDADDDQGLAFTSLIRFAVTNGEPIEVAVDNSPQHAGTIQLNWSMTATTNVVPLILSQPLSQLVPLGSNFTLSVTATNPGSLDPLTYQWQINGTNIVGATSSSFTVTNAQATNGGFYRVAVSNGTYTKTSQTANVALSVGTGQLINVGGKPLKCGSTTYAYSGRYPATGNLTITEPFKVITSVSSVSTVFNIQAFRVSTLTQYCTKSGVTNDLLPVGGTFSYYFQILSATPVQVYVQIQ
jgi:hypothetical protein